MKLSTTVAFLMLTLAMPPAHSGALGAAFTVTSLADDGGAGELRAAITAANADGGGDSITFANGLSGTITLASALPPILSSMTISGNGATTSAIDGAGKFRPFQLNAAGATLVLVGLSVEHGSDSADGAGGGGILISAGTLIVDNCVLSTNSAAGLGGAIENYGSTTVGNGSLTGNTATGGGGIANVTPYESTATLMVENCTLIGNNGGSGDGGGILNLASSYASAITDLTNCTLSGNATTGQGGAISNEAPASGLDFILGTANLSLTNCTMTDNVAPVGNGAISSIGAAMLVNTIAYGDSAQPEVLIANGTGDASYSDIQGGVGGSTGINDDGGNIAANPLLGNLADNGGSIQTIALGSASPCLKTGNELAAPAIDERLVTRPNPPSIGAFDYGTAVATVPTPMINPVAGRVSIGQEVTIDDATTGVAVYYTLDGSTPSSNSPFYTGPITISNSETIRAVAVSWLPGYFDSAIDTSSFTAIAPTPTFLPNGGNVAVGQSVTLSDALGGAVFYYTTDGSQPSASSTLYVGPIIVPRSETIKAIAVVHGYASSANASIALTVVNPFVVTTLTDNGQAGELRAAISNANAHPGSTITFQNGLAGTIYINADLPTITVAATIQGPGASIIAVDGGGQFRPFAVNAPASTVSISMLTIQNGNNSYPGGGGIFVAAGELDLTACNVFHNGGGGLNINGTANIASCTISNNTGGGLSNSGVVTFKYSTLSGNSDSGPGGAISNTGMISLLDCNLFGNSGYGGGAVATGPGTATLTNCEVSSNLGGEVSGGAFENNQGGTLTLTGCTVSDNSTEAFGGGIGNGGGVDNEGTVTLTDCTLTGNHADGEYGGAGGAFHNVGVATITNCTVSANIANNGGDGVFNSGQMTLINSIFWGDRAFIGNNNVEVVNPNGIVSASYCDIEGGAGGTTGISDSGANIAADPMLVSLAYNGGSTETMALNPGSPCFGRGGEMSAPATDQRGMTRPAPPSIGAYDVGNPASAAPATSFVVSTPLTATAGASFEVSITAVDSNGNATSGYSGTLSITSSDPSASLPSTTTLAGGSGTFAATLKTVGSQTIGVSNSTGTSLFGISPPISVAPGPTTRFSVSAPASAIANSPFTFTVTALDAYGNTTPEYADALEFSSTYNTADLPEDSTIVYGVGTFEATLYAGAGQSITVTDSTSPAVTGTSDPIDVGVDNSLVVTSLGDDGGAGELRWALNQASKVPGSTITFENGLAGTISLSSALPAIATSMTIDGPGATTIAIDGVGRFQTLDVNAPGDAVAISGLSLQNGYSLTGAAGILCNATASIADCSIMNNDGVGLVNDGDLTLSNCEIMQNTNGGVDNDQGGSSTVTHCVISGNSSPNGAGGLQNDGNVTVVDCTVMSNFGLAGGGIWNEGAITVAGTNIANNTATSYNGGGGIGNGFHDPANIIDCTLTGNTSLADDGGGIASYGTATVTNTTFSNNTASNGFDGGGIKSNDDLTVANCTFIGNTASSGGAIENDGNALVTNSTLSGNTATNGGAVSSSDGRTTDLTNCTLSGNTATNGGALWTFQYTSIHALNCIVYADTAPNGNEANGSAAASYSDVQGGVAGTTGISDNGGNISGNPLLEPLSDNGGATQTMALAINSPCFQTGNQSGAPTVDQRGFNRPNPPSMGAVDNGTVLATVTLTPETSLNGTLSPNLSKAVASGGTQAFVEAPANGYAFAGWIVDGNPVAGTSVLNDGTVAAVIGGTLTFEYVLGSHTVQATFAANTFTITPTLTPGGAIMPPDPQTITFAGSQAFTASGAAGYSFSNWTVDGHPVGASAELSDGTEIVASGVDLNLSNVQGNHTVAGNFVAGQSGVHTFAAGLAMIAVPSNYPSVSLASVLGYQSPVLAVWNPIANAYAVSPAPPANSLLAGQGYWSRFPQTVTIASNGTTPPSPFSIALAHGWNMVGSPQSSTVAVNALTVVDSTNASHSFTSAVSMGLVQNTLFTWQATDTSYEVVQSTSGLLMPYEGYWLFASQPCELIFQAP